MAILGRSSGVGVLGESCRQRAHLFCCFVLYFLLQNCLRQFLLVDRLANCRQLRLSWPLGDICCCGNPAFVALSTVRLPQSCRVPVACRAGLQTLIPSIAERCGGGDCLPIV